MLHHTTLLLALWCTSLDTYSSPCLTVTIVKGASQLQPNPSACSSHTCLHLTELKSNEYGNNSYCPFQAFFFHSPLDSFPILPIAQPCKLGVIDSHLFLGLCPGFLIIVLPAEDAWVTFKWLLKQERMLSAFSQGESKMNNWGEKYLPGMKLQCGGWVWVLQDELQAVGTRNSWEANVGPHNLEE